MKWGVQRKVLPYSPVSATVLVDSLLPHRRIVVVHLILLLPATMHETDIRRAVSQRKAACVS